jgi:hypothetical protein
VLLTVAGVAAAAAVPGSVSGAMLDSARRSSSSSWARSASEKPSVARRLTAVASAARVPGRQGPGPGGLPGGRI